MRRSACSVPCWLLSLTQQNAVDVQSVGGGLLDTNKRQSSFSNANHYQGHTGTPQSLTVLVSNENIRIPNKTSDLGIEKSITNAMYPLSYPGQYTSRTPPRWNPKKVSETCTKPTADFGQYT